MANIYPSERETARLIAQPHNRSSFRSSKWMLAFTLISVATMGMVLLFVGPASKGVRPGTGLDLDDLGSLAFQTAQNGMEPTTFLSKLEAPYPIHAFWFNWALADGAGPAYLLPYAQKCTEDGVKVAYPAARRVVTPTTQSDYFEDDLVLSSQEGYVARYATGYDAFSVTVEFETEGGGVYRNLAVRGSPYATVEYEGVTPVLHSKFSNVTSINGADAAGVSVSGTEFLLEQEDGMRWLIFASDSITFSVDEWGTSLTASESFTGTLRAAVSQDPETLDGLLRTSAGTYPTGGAFAYAVANDTATYTYTWSTAGGAADALLMGSVRHLSDILRADGAGVAAEAVYDSMKGPVDLLAGATWVLEEELPTITWYAPRKIQDEDKKQQMLAQLQTDVLASPPGAGDPYGAGKQFARMARLALIAEEHGDADSRDQAVATIVEYMDQWLEGANADPLVYETNWGGIVSSMGLQSWAADFGNGWYNDHHFHYGYFLYTLAVLIKFDPAYYSKHQGAIDLLLGDIANRDPESPLFPVARHKDFYDHHSWALGLFTTWDGKSQESSSEAVNAYYGVYLMGVATGDQELEDWGRVLLATELRGAHYYWQVHAGNEDIYDYYFAANRMVGQVGGLDAFCTTWFGTELEYIHGIQMLPFTPITEELLPRSYVELEWPIVRSALDDPAITPAWAGVLYSDFAIVDPEAAWGLMTGLDPTQLDSGFSMANAMYWVLTREDRGAFDAAPPAPRAVLPSCLVNTGCRNRGYDIGSCCPNEDGDYMSCCPVLPENSN